MITRSIPNLFTIGNLFLGIIAIIFVFNEEATLAAMMVIIAIIADGLDGRVARALKVQSEFGKELDSLSDVISFGVAPAFIVYVVSFQSLQPPAAGWLVTAIFPICGALRLARYNVVAASPGYFVGLPIPAAAGILSTLALFSGSLHSAVLIVVTLLLSMLMVSKIRYPSFKHIDIPVPMRWILLVASIAAVALVIVYPSHVTRFLFVPLVLYALYGLKKNVDRRGSDSDDEDSECVLLNLDMDESVKTET